MTDAARQLLDLALRLAPDERVRLANALYASVEPDDGDEDPALVEVAWREEIKHRLEDVDEGRVELVPFDDVIERARKRLDDIRARREP